MPTARELLEQADALMRRNRGRETLSPALGPRTMAPTLARRPAPGDFPVLTDSMDTPPPPAPPASAVLAASMRGARIYPAPEAAPGDPLSASTPGAAFADPERVEARAAAATEWALPEAAGVARLEPTLAPREAHDEVQPPAPNAFADVPVLTDAIAEIDAALLAVTEAGEPSIWNDEAMRGDDSVLGPAPKSIAAIPESHAIADAPRVAAAPVEADASRVAAATDELIDEVRMQVLQRIDMFTDTGLREQLGERLQPIVERASAELVATINQHVGELLRGYVAEAIERELERLRTEMR
jgi:hypothetical protein